MKKVGREGLQVLERALFRWTDVQGTGWFLFLSISNSGRVRRKGLDNEAWSYLHVVTIERYRRQTEREGKTDRQEDHQWMNGHTKILLLGYT